MAKSIRAQAAAPVPVAPARQFCSASRASPKRAKSPRCSPIGLYSLAYILVRLPLEGPSVLGRPGAELCAAVCRSAISFMRQIGATMGLAVAGSVFSAIYEGELPKSLAHTGLPPQLVGAATKLSEVLQGVGGGSHDSAEVLPTSQDHWIPQIISASNYAFARATAGVFWLTLITGVIGLAITLCLRDRKLRQAR